MEPETGSRWKILLKGRAGLILSALVVVILLVWLPGYRIFFLISVGIGLVVAAILYFWNKYRPIKEADEHTKRPLGL
jgi:O-antigen/teichoic acid export membrane protein